MARIKRQLKGKKNTENVSGVIAKTEKTAISKKNTAKYKRVTKRRTPYEKYLFANSWRVMPPSQAYIERLIGDMMEYISDPKVVKLNTFFLDRYMRNELVLELRKMFPDFEAAYDTAKQIVGERREDLAIYKKHETNYSVITNTLRLYHPDWKEVYEDSKKHDEKIADKTVVVVEKFPSMAEATPQEAEATPEEVASRAKRDTEASRIQGYKDPKKIKNKTRK